MILDSKLEFCDAMSVVQNTTSKDSTNVIDLGADGKDAFGDAKGNAIRTINWFVNVCTLLAGAATTVQLVTDTAATLDAAVVVLGEIDLGATQAAGSKFSQVIQARDLHRYLGLLVATAGNCTAGAIDSGMILGFNDSEISDK